MSNASGVFRTQRVSVGLELAFALILTGIVYVWFWSLTPPAVPALPVLAGSLAVGALVGGVGTYLDSRSYRRTPLESDLLFGIAMLALLVATVWLYPDGFALPLELGLLAAVWTAVLTELVTTATGD